jgi:hypothetical protein
MPSATVLLTLSVAVLAAISPAAGFPQPKVFGQPGNPKQARLGGTPFPKPVFDCPKLSPAPPATDVRKLRPGNIKAIMAMGDSITAGFAMKGVPPTDFLEYRDYVYSIGGAEDAFTLAVSSLSLFLRDFVLFFTRPPNTPLFLLTHSLRVPSFSPQKTLMKH